MYIERFCGCLAVLILSIFTLVINSPRAAAQAPFTLTLSPNSVPYYDTSTATITLAATSSTDTVFNLTSSNNAVASVPAQVTIAANATSTTFTINTSFVSSDTAVTISATTGVTTQQATLEVVVIGSWSDTTSSGDALGTAILLTDGTVIAHSYNIYQNWFRLTPDGTGNYADGTWTSIAPNIIGRLYGETAILQNGDFFYGGGEYLTTGSDNNTAEVYNPVANTWTQTPDSLYPSLGDSGSAILPDGDLLCSNWNDQNTDIYDPTTDSWADASPMSDSSGDEETWLTEADGSILSVYNIAQRYIPSENIWQRTLPLPVQLVDNQGEIGPGAELYDGRTLIFGATGNTAFYTPPGSITGRGSWTTGPTMPDSLGAADVPSCVEQDGKVLTVGSLGESNTAVFLEFDPTTNDYTFIPSPDGTSLQAHVCNMLALPNGQVLLTAGYGNGWVYTPATGPNNSWKPAVTGISQNADGSFTVTGTQLNGLTNGASYGDDSNPYSAYPIVSLVDTAGDVYYCRSYSFSQMNPSTSGGAQSASFAVPYGLPSTQYTLYVTASGVTSAGVPLSKRVTSVSVAQMSNPSEFDSALTFDATVTGNSPTGTVQFEIDGVDSGNPVTLTTGASSSTAAYDSPSLSVGKHTITAIYSGDTNNFASTISVTQVIVGIPTTVAISSSATLATSTFGTPITLTATVGGGSNLAGVVVFTDTNPTNGTVVSLGSTTLSNNTASITIATLADGVHELTASYGGDPDYASSTSSVLDETVTQAATSLSLSSNDNPSFLSQSISITATLSPAVGNVLPTGTVTFYLDSVAQSPITVSGGAAVWTTSSLTLGSHTITAAYSGDSNFSAIAMSASPPLTQLVTSTTSVTVVTSNVNPASLGQSVAFTATVTGSEATPTGTVTFSVDGTSETPVTLTNGTANYSTSSLTAGTHVIIATYNGGAGYTASTSSNFNEIVNGIGSTTALVSSLNPSTVGSSVTFTATVSGTGATPTGAVTFSIDGTAGSPITLVNGVATDTTSSLASGSHTITASYSGDSTYAAGGAVLTQTVNLNSSSITLASNLNPSTAGQSVTFTATVATTASSLTPTGTVTFSVDGFQEPAQPLSGGTTSFTDSSLSTGVQTVTATYSGDSNFSSSTTASGLSQTVDPAAGGPLPTISSFSPASGGAGTVLTITGTNLTGTTVVTFTGGATASPSSVTATGVTVTVPSGAATGTVSVTTPNGTGSSTGTFTFIGTLHQFATGLLMISAPVDDSSYTLSQDFDQTTKLAVWNTSTSSYTVSPTNPADTIRPGQGYWARFTTGTNLIDHGTTDSSTTPVTMTLNPGWNMIGGTQTSAIALSSLTIQTAGPIAGIPYSFSAAVASGIVSNTLYTYQAGDTAYETVNGSSGSLTPYEGYWIFAYVTCKVTFPAG